MATCHERAALESEVEKRGSALATNLVGVAQILLLEAGENPDEPLEIWEDRLTDAIVQQLGEEPGVVAARLIRRQTSDSGGITERIVASLDSSEHVREGPFFLGSAEAPSRTVIERRGDNLVVAAAVVLSGVQVGEAQIELDLGVLVEPVVAESRRWLTFTAIAVGLFGIVGGTLFVRILTKPLRELRSGVKRLADGDLTAHVTPTSRDEVGKLTRSFNEMADSLWQKERIQRAMGRYASDYVLTTLQEDPEGSELEGVEREVTIVFADIRNFTRLSEGLKARDVVALLNEIFQLASDRILVEGVEGGTIDKFIGDSVMAYFGAVVPDPDHAVHAVSAAVDIERAVAERNQQLGDDAHRVEVGIGIHTGVVVVGNIGSDRRTDFTAVGDAVNVAHRLEKLARPGEILVSEAVQRRVRGTVTLRFEGERHLSGRVEPVYVYSVDSSPAPARVAGRGDHAGPT
jgi:class 3 adenylate cyclase